MVVEDGEEHTDHGYLCYVHVSVNLSYMNASAGHKSDTVLLYNFTPMAFITY